ncbi:MAG: IucA/IucC family siderophore biosynthesis protein, partial [Proteobacteria bacterium]
AILSEPAFAALSQDGKAPVIESIVVARDNPFAAKDPAVVVATLAQEAPLGGESLLSARAREAGSACRWFHEFLRIAIEPFLVAEGSLGIILGAHQQNLLLSTENGWPKKAYFRDCHGTGYTAEGVARFLGCVPLLAEDNGNLVPARMGQVLFGYYLILNTVFNVVAGLAETTGEETALLEQLRAFLLEVRKRSGLNPAFIDYLTLSPKLLQKGNFSCAWASLNENTTADPLAIYTEIPNPLYRGHP